MSKAVAKTAAVKTETPEKQIDRSRFEVLGRYEGRDGSQEALYHDQASTLLFLETKSASGRERLEYVTTAQAFHWWHKCQLLDDGAGDFASYDANGDLPRRVQNVLFEMEPAYEKLIRRRQRRLLANPPKEIAKA